ncbi:MAG TPA: 3-methyl-2-oxobutanoate hydroxymethyltransferase [Acidobacteriota bacterium]
MNEPRITLQRIAAMKARGEPIAMVTAYDASMARLVDEAGVPMILVGDSLGQVMLGYDSTIPVTLDDMVRATAAVVRGSRRALIVADMPFMTYRIDVPTAARNAARLLQEGGAQAVKVEGGRAVAPIVEKLSDSGVPVMGHLGFIPQSVHRLGGPRVQGRDEATAETLRQDALALEAAGAFSIVLELMPGELAAQITADLEIPTIGIGAGVDCDGQVQVLHDLLGLLPDFHPKHARAYADLATTIREAVQRYVRDVEDRSFPSDKETFTSVQRVSTGDADS